NLDKTVQYIVKNFRLGDKHIPDIWAQMKETGGKVFAEGGGGDLFLKELLTRSEPMEIHIIGHSAGSIVLATLLERLNRHDPHLKNLKIKSCTLFAAACTEKVFMDHYAPAIRNGIMEHFLFYTLNDELERKDTCMTFAYRKSLLYAISECLEATSKPEKIIGMEIYAEENELINGLKDSKKDSKWIISNGCKSVDPLEFAVDNQSMKLVSKNKSHGGFAQDIYTMNSVIKCIVESDTIVSITPDPFFLDPCIRKIVVFGSVEP
ncbi:MAG: alpha/beta hydrolase, partial [Bacillota bacterium]|nr:alpha/beta hydrolase [Bacillota bacterium]